MGAKDGMKTQRERIVDYINVHGSITTAEAFNRLGISRFSARLFELKDEGYAFDEEWVTEKNRYGEAVSFKRFKFKEQKDA